MKITFDLPHVFVLGSSPEENRFVKAELQSCLRSVQSRGNPKRRDVPELKRTGKTQVTFDLPVAFREDSSPLDNALVLQALLGCLTRINVCYLTYRPNQVSLLYESGVYYKRTQVWDSIPALYGRRYGDCKSLACARCAEYVSKGVSVRPVFRWMPVTKGSVNAVYHILVQTPFAPPNRYEDPSKILGMGHNENAYFNLKAS